MPPLVFQAAVIFISGFYIDGSERVSHESQNQYQMAGLAVLRTRRDKALSKMRTLPKIFSK